MMSHKRKIDEIARPLEMVEDEGEDWGTFENDEEEQVEEDSDILQEYVDDITADCKDISLTSEMSFPFSPSEPILKRNKLAPAFHGTNSLNEDPLDLHYNVLEEGLDYFLPYIALFSHDIIALLIQIRIPTSLLDLFLFYGAVNAESMKEKLGGKVYEEIYSQLKPISRKKFDRFLQLLHER